jgi:glutathione synthase/RimK-type ligase-like ATP-grasp enzyme
MSAKRKQIAVITDRQDAHVPYVQRHLSQEMLILDPQALLEKKELSFSLEEHGMIPIYGDQRLDAVKSVWYRKPRDILPRHVPVPAEYRDYSSTALQMHAMQLLSAFKDALWISDYAAMRRASDKSWQLAAAKKLGFNTPATLMTSNADAARKFLSAQRSCVVKTYSSYSASIEKSFFTTKIDPKSPPNLDHLHLAPAIFQQAVDVDFDVRVTVIGDKVFAAIIRHKADKGSSILDWRLGHFDGDLNIEAYTGFPSDIAKLCVQHVKALGLVFGAIDLVMDKKGRLWFLENNPGGQWGFVERHTSLPIGKALAELLEKPA